MKTQLQMKPDVWLIDAALKLLSAGANSDTDVIVANIKVVDGEHAGHFTILMAKEGADVVLSDVITMVCEKSKLSVKRISVDI